MPIATRDGAGGGRTPAREAILDAARSLFAAHGLRGTTVRAIARRSGLSNTLLYYYFPRKDDLLDALLVPPDVLAPPAPQKWTGNSSTAATDYIIETFYRWADDDDFIRMVIVECYAGNQRVIGMLMAEIDVFIGNVATMLGQACSPSDAYDRARAISYGMIGMLWQGVMHNGPKCRLQMHSDSARDQLHNIIRLALPLPDVSIGVA